LLPSVTSRHLANYNDTHVLLGTRSGPHIVRPSRPHKFLFFIVKCPCNSYTVTTSLHFIIIIIITLHCQQVLLARDSLVRLGGSLCLGEAVFQISVWAAAAGIQQ